MFMTRSTILVPYNPGLTLSLALAYERINAGIGTELPLLRVTPLGLGSRPLEGEHDCLLTLPLGTGSIDEERLLGAPARPLMDEMGLSLSEVLKLGGASRVDVFVTVDNVGDLRGGVGVRGAGFVVDNDGLLVGVEDLAVDLVGVEDLAGTVGLDEDKTEREAGVGVEDLGLTVVVEAGTFLVTGFDTALDWVPKAGLLVKVEDLEPEPEPEPAAPVDDGLWGPAPGAGDAARGLDAKLLLPVDSC
ncbi:hypothetical protein Hanom_Chr14g01328561 [Helianthus anomalus]